MAGGPCEVPPPEDMVKDSIPKIPSNNIGSYPSDIDVKNDKPEVRVIGER
jgi:hypothetical protein